jgi:hypothetical protein
MALGSPGKISELGCGEGYGMDQPDPVRSNKTNFGLLGKVELAPQEQQSNDSGVPVYGKCCLLAAASDINIGPRR